MGLIDRPYMHGKYEIDQETKLKANNLKNWTNVIGGVRTIEPYKANSGVIVKPRTLLKRLIDFLKR